MRHPRCASERTRAALKSRLEILFAAAAAVDGGGPAFTAQHKTTFTAREKTDLVELAGEGHKEEGQLEHHGHDQRDEEQVIIVRDRRTHLIYRVGVTAYSVLLSLSARLFNRKLNTSRLQEFTRSMALFVLTA